jgi:poly(3-hydroxybutyrate) depolymerase
VIAAEDWAAEWAKRAGCIGPAKSQPKVGAVQPLFWSGCEVPVQLYRADDGGHTWPGSAWDEPMTNRDVSATDLIWTFVSDFTLLNP